MAGLPPIHGLYVGFFGSLLYALLGQCPQLSIGKLILPRTQRNDLYSTQLFNIRPFFLLLSGTFAIGSIMMNKVLQRYSDTDFFNNQTAVNTVGASSEAQAISVAVTVTFLVGVIQVGQIDLCFK